MGVITSKQNRMLTLLLTSVEIKLNIYLFGFAFRDFSNPRSLMVAFTLVLQHFTPAHKHNDLYFLSYPFWLVLCKCGLDDDDDSDELFKVARFGIFIRGWCISIYLNFNMVKGRNVGGALGTDAGKEISV